MQTHDARDFEKSAGEIISKARVVVLHGDNLQVRLDILRAIRRALQIDAEDPFRLVHLTSEIVDGDPARVADELGAISMFGGSRLIRVGALGRQLLEILDVATAAPLGEWHLVIELDELDAARLGSLKAYPQVLGVACGVENAGDFREFVCREFERAGVIVTDDVLEFLIPLLGDDRAAARGEVEKLALLAGNAHAITIDQALRVVADSSSVISDEIAAAALSGNLRALSIALDRLRSTGADAPAALGAASRLLLNVYRGKISQWKSRDGLAQSLSAAEVRALALTVQAAVLQTRSNSANAQILAERALVALSVTTQAKRR